MKIETKTLTTLFLLMVLSFTMLACGTNEAEKTVSREQIIEEYIHGQEVQYGWTEGSVTVSDENNLVIIEGRDDRYSSYEQNDVEESLLPSSGQVEVDLLKYSLKTNVILSTYSSDGYLLSVNYGQHPNATSQENNQAEEKISELTVSADIFASKNKNVWLEGFRIYLFNEYPDVYTDIVYEHLNNRTKIILVMASGATVAFDDEYQQLEFEEWWQRYTKTITLYLGTDVQIDFVSSDTSEVERTFTATLQGYLYE